jgi:hypothetical protein
MKTKRIITLSLLSFSFYLLSSQVPQGFNYQAIARDGAGNALPGEKLQVILSIQADTSSTPVILWEELHSPVYTNSYGLFTIVLGKGKKQSGSAATFNEINWSVPQLFIITRILYRDVWNYMGSAKLWSVPYSMISGDLSGPLKKLSVAGETSFPDSALFEVKNRTGQTVFAVYNEGVRVYVDDGVMKGSTKGGFAIGGFGTGKAPSQEFFRVTRDSTRIYLNDTGVKPKKGGFAIGGFDKTKGNIQDFMTVNSDSIRMYINDLPVKGQKGGFAIGGFSTTLTTINNFLDLTKDNYFIGHLAGFSNTTGLYNSYLGYQSGYSNITGNYNTFMGYEAGYSTNASWNTMIGYKAGRSNNFGQMNLFIGYQAGYSNTWGLQNVFLGYNAGWFNQGGYQNTFIGNNAGYGINSGLANIMLGSNAGNWFRKGDNNIYIGNSAGFAHKFNTDSAYNNIFIGTNAGRLITTGGENVFIGSNSGYNITTGSYNVFSGFETGYLNTSGNNNVFVGFQAGRTNSSGYKNTMIGYSAGYSNTTGWSNTFLGDMAGNANTSGSGNILIGPSAGLINNGDGNLFIGLEAGYSNLSGALNVFLGNGTGHANTTAHFNTFLGTQAGYSNQTGFLNVYVGMNAGGLNVSGSNNVFVGSTAGYYETGSNRLYIDNSGANKNNALIYGEFDTKNLTLNGKVGIGKVAPLTKLDIEGGNWDVAGGEGDFRIGSGPYSFNIGLANGGGGAGDVRLTAKGSGTNRLILGGGGVDVLLVTNTNVMPWSNNFSSLGASTNRWTTVYATNGVINTSDARLKSNIKVLGYGLDAILKLQPVSFTWNDDSKKALRIGLIAQDVEKVISEVVDKGNDPARTLGINYSEIVPVLIKGIQEQQTQIETVRQENIQLKSANESLLEQIRSLQNRMEQVEAILTKSGGK